MKKILVAIDSSSRAADVLSTAAAVAQAMGARLRLFRAVPVQPELPWDMIREFPPGGLEEVLMQEAKADLRARAELLPSGVLDGVGSAVGKPWSAICAAAREYEADLIVIGSHGYGAVDHILGTTAAKVVNHADRSVLVARA